MAGARIQLKRATASSWNSNNPVLFAGEIGLETDTNKFKIGDGTTAYNSLPYFNGNLTGSSLNDLADVTITDATNGDFLRWNGTAWINDAVNLSTDTVGDYMVNVVGGTGVTVTHTQGEGSTASVAIGQDVGTSASVTFAHVSAPVTGNVVGDLTGNADTASTLETARIIELSGDVTGSASFDGSSNINISVTSNPDSIELGTDTTGNYVVDLAGGTGVTITHTPGEGSTASVAIGQDVSTTASVTFDQLTVNGQTNVGGDIIPDTTEAYDLGSASARFRDIYLSGTTIDLGGATITSDGTDISFSGGINVGGSANFVGDLTGNADTASTLETARTISLAGDLSGSVSFDGSTDVTITATVEPDSVELGADTTGNFVNDVVAGTGVTVTHTPGEGSSASIAIGQDVSTTASVTFSHVSADVAGNLVGDVTGNADTATAFETARTISLAGDLSGSVLFDGTADVTVTATVQPDSVALGTDTTGNYMVDVVGGTGVTVTHTAGEGSSASVAIGQDVATTASVTFAHVSAPVTGNVVGDLTGNADTASTLETSRAISLAGDLSGSVSFDGSTDVTITATVQPDSVALGTDTTGNYVNDVVAGTGVTVTHTPGEGSSASIAIGQSVGTTDNPSFAGLTADNVQIGITGANEIDTTSGNLTIDSAGGTVTVDDDLVVTGTLTVSGSATYVNTEILTVDDNIIVLNNNQTGAPSQNAGIEVERGDAANVQLRWNETNDSWEITEDGTTYRNIAAGQDVETSSSVTFAAVTAPVIGNASTASALQTARAISLSGDLSGSVSFDGSANVTLNATVEPNSVALGTDTTGNYLVDLAGQNGVSITHTPGEGSTASISLVQDINTSSSVTFAHVSADLTGDVTGNASTATTLETARAISLAGDLSGSVSFDGSTDVTITATVQPDSVALGTDTTGNYMTDVVAGTGITVTHTPGEGSSASVAIGQDVATTASVTFTHVTADVTGDLTGNADTATTLETARAISLAGDLSGSASFDGSQNITITATVQPDSVALGTDTTGNFVADVVAGHAITVTHTPGEASSASVALNASLDDLNDVSASAAEKYQTLVHDGAGWESEYPTVVSLAGNAESTTLTVGTAVYLFGGTGNHASVKRADNSSDATSSKTVGLVAQSIAAGNAGPVITRGYLKGVDLSVGYTNGDILWLGENGQLTTTKPQAPDHLVFIGVVVSATNNGIIYVATQNGYEIEELHDVKVSSVANKDVLMWNSASAVWVNEQINLGTDTVGDYVQNLVAGTGVTLSNNSGEGSTPTVAIGQDVSTSASVVFYNLETTHDLTIGGDLYVSGSVVTENQASLVLDDPFIYLNGSSSVTNPDLGIAGNYNDGTYKHAGIFRDATDGKFKFFDSYTPEPTHPIDTEHGSYSPAPVVAETFESTVTTGTAPFTVASTTEVANLHADTASSLHTARAISLGGDLSGSVSFDGSANVTLTATVEPNSVALGTDTTGNYMVGVAEGTGVTIVHTPGEGSTASISIGQAVETSSSVTFAAVTAPLVGNASTASTLQTARAISLAGDLSGSASFDGGSDVTITATVQPNSVALGTDTTGNYVNDVVAGTGVTITHTPGEGSTASVAIGQDVATTASVTFAHVSAPLTGNVSGNVTGNVTGNLTGNADTATSLQTSRAISLSGDLSGSASFNGTADVTITATVQPNSVALGADTTGNYVSDVTGGTGVTITHIPGEGSSPTIAIGQAVGTSSSVTFAHVSAPVTGNVTGNVTGDVSGNAGTATALQTSRAISLGGDLSGSASFNGSSDITITATVQPDSVALGTDTTGNYMSNVVAGTGVTITHTPGEGSSASVAIGQAVGTTDNPSFAGVTADAVQIGISAAGEIDTVSGNLTIDSAGGTVTVDDNLIVSGDLTVNGTTTTVNTETINLADNIIVLNSNETGSPSQNAGIEVERGTSANVAIRWNETSDKWEFTENGTAYFDIASESYVDAQSITALDDIGDVTITSASAGQFLKWNGTAWVNELIDLGTDTVGNYVSDVTAGTGVTVTHTPGEGSSPTIAIGQAVSTSSSVTFAAVTAPVIGNASTATTLQTSRTIELTGDVTGSVSFNGSANASIAATIAPNSVALGTDTTGNYVSDVVSGTGITVTHTPGEGSSASVALNAALNDLTDVSAASPSDGEFLKYVSASSAWVPAAIPTINALDDIGDVSASAPTTGHFLKWDGSAWVPAAAGAAATTTSITTNSATTIDSFSMATAHAAEFTVKVEQGQRFLSNKVLVLHNDATVDFTKYGEISMGAEEIAPGSGATTWVTRTSNFGDTQIRSIAYGNGLWVSGGYYGEIRTSTDAVTWVTRTSNFSSDWSGNIKSVAYGNNLWVAGALTGQLRISTDAITWVTQESNFDVNITSIAFGNNLWVAVGYQSQLRSSTDAITWVTRTSNFVGLYSSVAHIMSVAYGNNLWVAGGYYGELRTSTDAITWVTQTSNFSNGNILSVAYGNNLWVAGGAYGFIRTSTDAIAWTTQLSNVDDAIFSVAYGNSLWVAGGYTGQIRTSTDAITWVTRTSNFGNTRINSIAFGNNLWVAGGGEGQLRTSATDTAFYEIPVTLSADISGSDVRLRATITDASTTNASVKVLKTLVEE